MHVRQHDCLYKLYISPRCVEHEVIDNFAGCVEFTWFQYCVRVPRVGSASDVVCGESGAAPETFLHALPCYKQYVERSTQYLKIPHA